MSNKTHRDLLQARSPEEWGLFAIDCDNDPVGNGNYDDCLPHTNPDVVESLRRTALALDGALKKAVLCFRKIDTAAARDSYCAINAICRAVAEVLPPIPLDALLSDGEIFEVGAYWDCVLPTFAEAVYVAVYDADMPCHDCLLNAICGECYQEHCQDVTHGRSYSEYAFDTEIENANTNEVV